MLSLLRYKRKFPYLLQIMAQTRRSSSLPDEWPAKRARKAKRNNGTPHAKAKTGKYIDPVNSPWYVGAHVSVTGGVENAIMNAASIAADAFALFLKSPRKWTSPALTAQNIEDFKARMEEYHYEPRYVLPHGSYLINLGNPDPKKREKSYGCFVDDLHRCEQLGLEVYNFHVSAVRLRARITPVRGNINSSRCPGSSVGTGTTAESIALIAECLNRAHKTTTSVMTVLENMAGTGYVIGSQFSHLADIIAAVEDKSRVGVCLDTCHMFAAGYDIRTKKGWEDTVTKFDQQIGLSYLRAMHLNDSKTELASNRDRHETIGMGFIGLESFYHILTDPRVQGIPLILETPEPETYATEIEVLNALSTYTELDDKKKKALLTSIRKSVKRAGPPYRSNTRKRKGRKKPQQGEKKNDEDEEEYCDH
ncbi:AP endonuclease [Guyanagaster necrorhizus]|uniref:Apurinic-apyrimidinic endonuclease 1 n=1 Tax=Guyanagaster necrorhizus TaxID=856835 RepID=A0A9P7VKP3_9AGAR|nr:AP endonuclease [Guyanagaster necrorhizus MCA 3950]KAG7442397.1 AP endonuclease [Guyanagaster necrorhizus MCA 3950]